MNRILFSFLFIYLFTHSVAQESPVLLTIGDKKISQAEFERIYKKNNSNLYNESDKKSPKEYLELFIDFKLKVIEAESLQMDTNSIFINELEGYRKELAKPYLTDVKYDEQMVQELYNRMTKEVNASHILLRVKKGASEAEEQAVLTRILKIKREIDSGKDFGQAAAQYSEDPSAKSNKGNLNYFTAFQMVAPFENAAFSTPVGKVSEPIKSSFGYHLIKVHDIRINRGEIKVAHIMKIFPRDVSPEAKESIRNTIFDIYVELQNGADFSKLAKTKSDDKKSAAKGGEMPWFASGRVVKEISEPAFALRNIGDYTPPVESQFGFHILKKLDERGVASFEESRANIEDKIKKDPARNNSSKIAFINKLKLEYNFNENQSGIKLLQNKNIGEQASTKNTELFTLAGKNYSIRQFEDYLKQENVSKGKYMDLYPKWIEAEITKYEDSRLEEKYPDFKYIMQEYHDGMLLFNISEEKIWNYASEDSIGLQSFYEKNKKNHLWDERFKGIVVTCADQETREEADKYFASGMSSEEILDVLNAESEKITITKGAWEKSSNAIVDYFVWDEKEPDNFNNELTFIRGDKIPPEPKSLEDSRGLYISDYQNYIEKNWLKQLRKKYKITVNKKLLKTLLGA